jgi:hypothetical protein
MTGHRQELGLGTQIGRRTLMMYRGWLRQDQDQQTTSLGQLGLTGLLAGIWRSRQGWISLRHVSIWRRSHQALGSTSRITTTAAQPLHAVSGTPRKTNLLHAKKKSDPTRTTTRLSTYPYKLHQPAPCLQRPNLNAQPHETQTPATSQALATTTKSNTVRFGKDQAVVDK